MPASLPSTRVRWQGKPTEPGAHSGTFLLPEDPANWPVGREPALCVLGLLTHESLSSCPPIRAGLPVPSTPNPQAQQASCSPQQGPGAAPTNPEETEAWRREGLLECSPLARGPKGVRPKEVGPQPRPCPSRQPVPLRTHFWGLFYLGIRKC